MASGNMKDIKRRIKSVQSTMQITKAMELVASSKMRRAKERALSVRPYFNAMYETVARLASVTRDSDSVYTRRREVKNSLYIVIAGDRGLAGGYNSNVFKLAAAEARDSYDKLSPREAASTMRTRADEAMEAARRASQTARLNAAEAAKAVKLAAQGKAEQTTAFLQLEQLKEELATRAQVMQARTRRGTHLLGKGRMLRAYPRLKHGQNNRSLSSLLEQLEDEYPDSFNGFGIQ